MNLIYICVFHQEGYINLLKLLITSIYEKGNLNTETTDILIMTTSKFKEIIQEQLKEFTLNIHYYTLDSITTLFQAGCARLNIFKYPNINKYDTILYIDTDILINSDINILFDLELSSDKMYTLEEGDIGSEWWGGKFFDFSKYDRNIKAFTSGILFFRNSNAIISLFDSIESHIQEDFYIQKNPIGPCLDQPYIVYNTITQNKCDNKTLIPYVENNPSRVLSTRIIYHFPGGPGSYDNKINKMKAFWNKMNNIKGVLDNKKYSWGDSSITFLEDGLMDAFGSGNYVQTDTYNFHTKFGGRETTIVFNNDYTEFTATRIGDNYIVQGKLI